ncbi:hypothetical protein FXW07_08120 [Methanosarcina sp. DH1]|nr:hypothetical protein [Methanosarcina sp. DH1]
MSQKLCLQCSQWKQRVMTGLGKGRCDFFLLDVWIHEFRMREVLTTVFTVEYEYI